MSRWPEVTGPIPENGWLVVCMVLGQFNVVHELDTLASVIGRMREEAERKFPETFTPIQVWELGRQMDVGLNWKVTKLEPMPERKR